MPHLPGILILHNAPLAPGVGGGGYAESDAGVLDEVRAVKPVLRAAGHPVRVAAVRALKDVPRALETGREPLVFNLVERLDDFASAFNYVPAICQAHGRSCTGGDSDALGLTLDKWLGKARLRACGLPVADAALLNPGADPATLRVPAFPLIVKPLNAGGSEGIDARHSLAGNRRTLEHAIRHARRLCPGPILIERFIEGREFNLSLYEKNGRVIPLPVSEVDFSLFPKGRPPIVDYAVKWIAGTIPGHVSPRCCPARVHPRLAERVQRTARLAWAACGCRDYARVDFRMDRQGRLYILEVNLNPDISPLAGLPAALRAAAIPFQDFVLALVENAACRRRAVTRPAPRGPA